MSRKKLTRFTSIVARVLVMASALCVPASSTIVTLQSCRTEQVFVRPGVCAVTVAWEFQDVLLTSGQLDGRLGGVLAAIGVRTTSGFSGQAFGGPFTGLDAASAPSGWTITMDPTSLPFSDPTLVAGQFVYFFPPAPVVTPQDLGNFAFSTEQSANVDSLLIEVRGSGFAVGELGPFSDFGPIIFLPPLVPPECIPEPSGIVLIGSGVLGLIATRRRSRGSQALSSQTLS